MSLATLDPNKPAGADSVEHGAAEIRQTRKDTKDSFALEHRLTGQHNFPNFFATPTAGRISLTDRVLAYGTDTAWQMSSMFAEGGEGGQGGIIDGITPTTAVRITLANPYERFGVWVTGNVKINKPPAYFPTVNRFYGEIRVGSDAFYFPLLRFSGVPQFVNSADFESLWCPINEAVYINSGLTPPVDLWVVFWLEFPSTGVSLEFLNHVCLVITSG